MPYNATNVSVAAGSKKLINDLSVTVTAGVFSVILGPNGAGKSTLLKVFSNDIKPQCGTVTLDGDPISGLDRNKLARRRAVLPQSSTVTFNFTAYDIVKMGRIPHNESDAASEVVIDEVMALTKTTAFAARQYNTLSGGERQRVQFARVLAQIWPDEEDNEGKYLLLDEPTSALDPLYQIEILNIAKWFAKERGFGVLAVLHDLNQAMSYADDVYLLKQGKLDRHGAPTDVLTEKSIFDLWGIHAELIMREKSKIPSIVPIMNTAHTAAI